MTDEKFAAVVAAVLRQSRLRLSTERALQDSIAEVLTAAKIPFEREKALSKRDRPDFLLADGRVVLEAKFKYPKKAIYRQLARYAEHDQVTVLMLITGTAMGMVDTIQDKPVVMISAGMGSMGC